MTQLRMFAATRRVLLGVVMMTAVCTLSSFVGAAEFKYDWSEMPDRTWVGPQYWANPMEDWAIRDGHLECLNTAPGRNVHLLTRQLDDRRGEFRVSVRLSLVEGEKGSAGFEVGIHDKVIDYRGNCFFGSGVSAYITTDGRLRIGNEELELENAPALEHLELVLEGKPEGEQYRLTLSVPKADGENSVSRLIAAEQLIGNIALTHNSGSGGAKRNARFRFDAPVASGSKVEYHKGQTFGPILWSMYTLSDSRGDDGHVMRMTAQMPPVGEPDSPNVRLQIKRENKWTTIRQELIDQDARTATFRVAQWPKNRDVAYRLAYTLIAKDGASQDRYRSGTVRKDPVDKEFVLAGMTCQMHYGFPYTPLTDNLAKINPDLLYFSGDQIYESNGNFGIIRTPDEKAIVNYLRKFYMFGWAFGDLMRDRPTVCLPDDHDVFHGNLWGEGGAGATTDNASTANGYLQSARFVNAVHRSQSSHNPDLYDATPGKRDVSVLYTDMVYGNVSFAIVADRQFKSGPNHVDTGSGRPDHLADDDIDASILDKPGLKMLGDRQVEFLEHWVEDWRGADMKVLLTQTLFANSATHHGKEDNYLRADLDSGGWPQSARNKAVRLIRKGFPLHVNGDQHLTSLIQYGADEQRDGSWSFCTPAISVGYQRWWRADEMGKAYANRPTHGMPNTGEYLDGFDNLMYVYAVGNPEGSKDENRYQQAQVKASGFGVVRLDHDARTYTCESYRFLADLENKPEEAQFPGWPLTISQTENFGRERIGTLGTFKIAGVDRPVVKVYAESTGELVYALRSKKASFRPWVFEKGKYTVKVGDPDKDVWETHKGQTIE